MTTVAPAVPRPRLLRPVARRTPGGIVFEVLLWLALFLALLALATLLVQMLAKGWSGLSWHFLTSDATADPTTAGLKQSLVGSLYIMGITIAVALPLGVATAVYLEEYARDSRLTRVVQVNIRNLAAVPSIVYGLLGLAIFVPAASAIFGGPARGRITLAGGLTLAILVLPIVIIAAAEAIRSVPQMLREAAFGLGATKWQVIRSQILPNALPGILTGSVLAVSRGIGESAPLLLVGGLTGSGVNLDVGLTTPYTALPLQIFAWTRAPNFVAQAASAIIALLAVLLVLNSAAILLRNKYHRSW